MKREQKAQARPPVRKPPTINKRPGMLVCICTAKGSIVYLRDDYKREFDKGE